MTVPAQPKLYHIVHVDRLRPILASGGLLSDARLIEAGGAGGTTIGMGRLKQHRLTRPVDCHPGTNVGDYVPFYLCSRSLMLYVIYMANHPDLSYRGGQGPIVHLEYDLHAVAGWAAERNRRWAFSLGNASANYAEFRNRLDQLDEIDWAAVANHWFNEPVVKEAKQAEFLVFGKVPWRFVERIGVRDRAISTRVAEAIAGVGHRPRLEIVPQWYY